MKLALALLVGITACVQSDVVHCGDKLCPGGTVCASVTSSCATDCGPCAPLCGDLVCDPAETCPGDCP